jgi:hypothetical protein
MLNQMLKIYKKLGDLTITMLRGMAAAAKNPAITEL